MMIASLAEPAMLMVVFTVALFIHSTSIPAIAEYGLHNDVGLRVSFALGLISLLMVAVADVRVDGTALEGRPVQPDVLVERPIPYCNGADPQLDAAYRVLIEAIRAGQPL